MKKLFTTILAVCTVCIATAQAPEIEWQKSFGGTGAEGAEDIQLTSDGGFIIAGYTSSSDGDVTGWHEGYDYSSGSARATYDFWIVKIDASKNIQWQKTYGGTKDDVANSIQQTADGGYIVAGYTKSNDGDVTGLYGGSDYLIMKLDANGNREWWRIFGGSGTDAAQSVQQTWDGGYIIAGYTDSPNDGNVTGNHGWDSYKYDFWIIKLNPEGNIEWKKAMGGFSNEKAYSIKETADSGSSGYIIVGSTSAFVNPTIPNDGDVTEEGYGLTDWWIVKTDNIGNIQWQKRVGGNLADDPADVHQTTDGGYIVAGHKAIDMGNGNVGQDDYLIVKFDTTGNVQWQKEFGGNVYHDQAYSVEQTTDGGFIIAGYGNNVGVNADCLIIKLDENGNTQWQEFFGGSRTEMATSIRQITDGGYIVAGRTNSDDGDVTGYHGGTYFPEDYWIFKIKVITYVPDTAFEQRLIDLGLDDILDGYVLTSNISDVTQLDVSNRNISDLTGIEDFASLVSLNCSNNQLTNLVFGDGTGGRGTNFTTDFGLEYLNASGNQLTSLDVSGLSSLTTLLVNNNSLTALNVQNGNNVNFNAFNATNNPDLLCIQVDDAMWSTTNWTNIDAQTSFNEDCAFMAVSDQQLSKLEVYPNPAKDIVNFSKAIDGELYNAAGQKVLTFKNASSVNVSKLEKGIYMLKTSEGITKKILVK